jgi:hypothetical protein
MSAATVRGSRHVGPARTSKLARRSEIRRAIGPSAAVSWIPIDTSVGSTELACGIRPRVGFSAEMPQHWAGQRSDPRPSFPSPRGVMPVASAAASPPLEAPAFANGPTG